MKSFKTYVKDPTPVVDMFSKENDLTNNPYYNVSHHESFKSMLGKGAIAAMLATTPYTATGTPTNNTDKPNQQIESPKQVAASKSKTMNFIAEHEGRRNVVYTDTTENPTIGIGFNLNRSDARNKLSSVKANYDKVRAGTERLNNKQIYTLFEEDYDDAVIVAKRFVRNFEVLPENAQMVLIDLAFNLGPSKLFEFQKFRKALESRNYIQAAEELKNSRWYKQVKRRGIENVKMIRELA